MNLHIYRYGQSFEKGCLYVGTTRYVPRGVRREDYAKRGYFDVWLPLLAPSSELVSAYQKGQISFPRFTLRYRAEMRLPAARQTIRLLAALASRQRVSLGCYCADPAHCHRTLLHKLVLEAAADLPVRQSGHEEFSSPACSMPELEN